MKTGYGVETVDELSRDDFTTYKEFYRELKRLEGEYLLAGMNVYISKRPDTTWNAKQ
jgi:hypothetical protein